jgi:xanthosine utilization system XapX-like protein
MKTRGMGRSIMAAGVVCFIIYMLLTLRGPSPINVQSGGILFYVGIVALPLGAILFLFGEMKR